MPLSLPSTDPKPLAEGLHQTDAFHRQPLLQVKPARGQQGRAHVVRSWDEAHALHGPARLDDVNPAYVAALISGHPDAAAAPYARIRRLPRAHHVLISGDGSVHSSSYDPFAAGAEAMPAERLHAFLRQGLLDHLRQALEGHEGPVGCEHSSGLDSNAVLGGLRHGLGLPPERLHTWSSEEKGEGPPLREFRPFHGLHADHCHGSDLDEPAPLTRKQRIELELSLLGAPTQIGGIHEPVNVLHRHSCTLIFSGFGGDQAISHNANNVPTDLATQGRWRQLRQWTGSRRMALRTGAGRMLGFHLPAYAQWRIRLQSRDFVSSDLLQRSLTEAGRAWLGPHLKANHPWEIDGYVPLNVSIRRRVLADWVAMRAEQETRMAAAYGITKVFPLLDERLIGTILRQDPLLFGEGLRRGRLLHRRAFAPFLPPALRDDPSKARLPDEGIEAWRAGLLHRRRQELSDGLESLNDRKPALARWWDLDMIRREAETILASLEPTLKQVAGTAKAIATLEKLTVWWQSLEGGPALR